MNSSKPGRPDPFSLLVHSTNRWADHHLELDREQVIDHLCTELGSLVDYDPLRVQYKDLHRWLYANIGRQHGSSSLVDPQHRLAAIGDWCISGRVESAFTSGAELDLGVATA